jgi:hypothetical protein
LRATSAGWIHLPESNKCWMDSFAREHKAQVIVTKIMPYVEFVSRASKSRGKVKTKVTNMKVKRTGHVVKHTEN